MKALPSRSLYQNNHGQSVMEYVILSGLIGLFCLGAIKGFGGKLRTKINKMGSKIETSVNWTHR